MRVFEKIGFYWKETKFEAGWDIAVRNRKNGKTLLEDLDTPFNVLRLPRGYWGADPLAFEYGERTFLFFELFRIRDSKGLIACIEFNGNLSYSPKIIIEDICHLSFPFVFMLEDRVFMIPESGAISKIELYECLSFPYKWKKNKILKDNINGSDTIVYKYNGNVYVLASVLTSNNPCEAKNILYRLDSEKFVLNEIGVVSESSTHGIRNAGPMLHVQDNAFRPGQNCDKNIYGKSILFFQQSFQNEKYNEDEVKEIKVEDIKISKSNSEKSYSGIHTYSLSSNFEFIDLKYTNRNTFPRRMKLFYKRIIELISVKM